MRAVPLRLQYACQSLIREAVLLRKWAIVLYFTSSEVRWGRNWNWKSARLLWEVSLFCHQLVPCAPRPGEKVEMVSCFYGKRILFFQQKLECWCHSLFQCWLGVCWLFHAANVFRSLKTCVKLRSWVSLFFIWHWRKLTLGKRCLLGGLWDNLFLNCLILWQQISNIHKVRWIL